MELCCADSSLCKERVLQQAHKENAIQVVHRQSTKHIQTAEIWINVFHLQAKRKESYTLGVSKVFLLAMIKTAQLTWCMVQTQGESKTVNEKGTQTSESYTEYGDREVHPKVNNREENVDDKMLNVPGQEIQSGVSGTIPEQTEITKPGRVTETVNGRNPQRIRKKPAYLQEFETENTVDKLQICVDSCYRAVCDIPQTYQDAITSAKSRQWKNAMNKEMLLLEENKTLFSRASPLCHQASKQWGQMGLCTKE